MIVTCSSCAKSNRVPAARLRDKARCAACKEPLLPIARPVPIDSAEDFDELLRDAKVPVLVDFWASWCGPCRTLGPELEKVAKQSQDKVVIAKVDTDAQPQIAGRFGFKSIPTMIVFRGGKEIDRLTGAMPAAAITARLPH